MCKTISFSKTTVPKQHDETKDKNKNKKIDGECEYIRTTILATCVLY